MRGVNCKLQVVSVNITHHAGLIGEANFIFPMYTRPVAMVVEYILAHKEKLSQHYVRSTYLMVSLIRINNQTTNQHQV